MRVINSLTDRAGRLAGDMQDSLRRARMEGERRLLQRQHRTALEELGLRTYELVKAGELPDGPISTEVAAVENRLIEIEAKVAEIDGMRDSDTPGTDRPSAPADDDPALAAFPMIREEPPADG